MKSLRNNDFLIIQKIGKEKTITTKEIISLIANNNKNLKRQKINGVNVIKRLKYYNIIRPIGVSKLYKTHYINRVYGFVWETQNFCYTCKNKKQENEENTVSVFEKKCELCNTSFKTSNDKKRFCRAKHTSRAAVLRYKLNYCSKLDNRKYEGYEINYFNAQLKKK